MKKKLLLLYFKLIMERSKRKFSNEKWLTQCCSCWKLEKRTNMLWWHFIPQKKWWTAKVMLDNVNSQHSICNANQHREGKNGEQYKYGIWIDKTYGKWYADKIISDCNRIYTYSIDSITKDIDDLLALMRAKLKVIHYKNIAHLMLQKRIGIKMHKLLFIDNATITDLLANYKNDKTSKKRKTTKTNR